MSVCVRVCMIVLVYTVRLFIPETIGCFQRLRIYSVLILIL